MEAEARAKNTLQKLWEHLLLHKGLVYILPLSLWKSFFRPFLSPLAVQWLSSSLSPSSLPPFLSDSHSVLVIISWVSWGWGVFFCDVIVLFAGLAMVTLVQIGVAKRKGEGQIRGRVYKLVLAGAALRLFRSFLPVGDPDFVANSPFVQFVVNLLYILPDLLLFTAFSLVVSMYLSLYNSVRFLTTTPARSQGTVDGALVSGNLLFWAIEILGYTFGGALFANGPGSLIIGVALLAILVPFGVYGRSLVMEMDHIEASAEGRSRSTSVLSAATAPLQENSSANAIVLRKMATVFIFITFTAALVGVAVIVLAIISLSTSSEALLVSKLLVFRIAEFVLMTQLVSLFWRKPSGMQARFPNMRFTEFGTGRQTAPVPHGRPTPVEDPLLKPRVSFGDNAKDQGDNDELLSAIEAYISDAAKRRLELTGKLGSELSSDAGTSLGADRASQRDVVEMASFRAAKVSNLRNMSKSTKQALGEGSSRGPYRGSSEIPRHKSPRRGSGPSARSGPPRLGRRSGETVRTQQSAWSDATSLGPSLSADTPRVPVKSTGSKKVGGRGGWLDWLTGGSPAPSTSGKDMSPPVPIAPVPSRVPPVPSSVDMTGSVEASDSEKRAVAAVMSIGVAGMAVDEDTGEALLQGEEVPDAGNLKQLRVSTITKRRKMGENHDAGNRDVSRESLLKAGTTFKTMYVETEGAVPESSKKGGNKMVRDHAASAPPPPVASAISAISSQLGGWDRDAMMLPDIQDSVLATYGHVYFCFERVAATTPNCAIGDTSFTIKLSGEPRSVTNPEGTAGKKGKRTKRTKVRRKSTSSKKSKGGTKGSRRKSRSRAGSGRKPIPAIPPVE